MNAQPSSPTNRALALASAGRVPEAVALLGQAGDQHDADACFTLAAWKLAGQIVPRDLAAARELFGRAAEAGREDAHAIQVAFIANGTGGPRDWPAAIAQLDAREANPEMRRQLAIIQRMELDGDGDPARVPEPEVLSDTPWVRLFRAFFSKDECAFLADAAQPLFAPSTVVDPASAKLVRDPIRTSDVAAFPLVLENPAIHALNRRMAAASQTKVEQGEPLQVLRYRPGQEYKPHFDELPAADNQRILTLIVWLNDGFEGGETVFLSNGLCVRGGTGDALLFRNADRDGRPDPAAQHAGLPVTRGVKQLASRWIRARPLDLSDTRR